MTSNRTKYNSCLWLAVMLYMIPISVHANICDSLSLTDKIIEVQHLNETNNPSKAKITADAILNEMENKVLASCTQSLWLKYERGHSIELEMRFEEALGEYYDIIKLAEKKKEWELVAQSYISIARCHEFTKRIKDCKRNLDLAEEIIENNGLSNIIGRHCIRSASYHRLFGSRDTAEMLALKAIEYGNKHKVHRTIVDGHLLMGIVSTDFKKSVWHFRKTIELFNKKGNYEAAAFMHQNLVSRYLSKNDIELAKAELDSALNLIPRVNKNSIGYYEVNSHYYELKHRIFNLEGNIDSAYHNLTKSLDFEKQAAWQVDQEKITQNALAFEIEKEKLKAEELIKQTQIQRFLLGLFAFLGLLISLFAYNNYLKKKKIAKQSDTISLRNKELNHSLRKQSILLSEVHHRVKNNLQLIISLLHLHGNEKGSDGYLNKKLTNKIRSISLIHELLYNQEEYEHININEYLKELVKQYRELNALENSAKFDLDIKNIHLNLDTVLPLGIVCSELLNNTFKYAVKPQQRLEINISLKPVGDMYEMTYKDNGPGYADFNFNSTKKPIGMKLIQNLVRQLLGTSSFYNESGAAFKMAFREKEISSI